MRKLLCHLLYHLWKIKVLIAHNPVAPFPTPLTELHADYFREFWQDNIKTLHTHTQNSCRGSRHSTLLTKLFEYLAASASWWRHQDVSLNEVCKLARSGEGAGASKNHVTMAWTMNLLSVTCIKTLQAKLLCFDALVKFYILYIILYFASNNMSSFR